MRWAVGGVLTAGMLLLAGCRAWQTAAPVNVARPIVRGQLVISADFPLANEHPLLAELDTQREDIAQTLRLPTSTDPIHVCLFGTSEQYQAFMKARYPDFPNRRACFVETDARLMVFAHWNERVAEDLRHEVAHGNLHSVVRNLPLWLDEGLAEYFEVPPGNQGFNAPHVELLLAASHNRGWQPDLTRLEHLTTSDAMTQLDYAEAWAWMHFLLRTEPARRSALQGYLAGLRKDGSAPPLSLTVRQLGLNPADLVNHLQQLRPNQAPVGR